MNIKLNWFNKQKFIAFDDKRVAAIYLCGAIRGLMTRIPGRNWENETEIHKCLKTLGCPERFLPRGDK